MKKIQFVQEILNARTLFVQALSVSVINQLKLHNFLCLCLASVHLPHPFHLVFGFQLFGHAVALHQLRHDQLHAISCRFVNLSAILSYVHPAISGRCFCVLSSFCASAPEGRTPLSARRTHRFLRESAANPQLPSGPIVGIGAYGTPANPYCLANFERKAFLSQIFKRSCSQIRCTVTGRAYQSARKVSMCVRSDKKIGAHRNSTCSMHQTYPSALFSPIFSRAREKIGPSET